MAKHALDLTNENQSTFKVILLLAWPLFLEQVLSTLVSFVDTAMVGSLGAAATASVSISNSFVFLINGVVIALGVGITAYVARSVGARDYQAAKAYIRHALLLLLFIGVPVALLPVILYKQIPIWMGAEAEYLKQSQEYLLITSSFRIFTMAIMVLGSVYRGRGDTKTPLRVNIVVNIINVVGNYLLIHDNHIIHLGLFGAELNIPMPAILMEPGRSIVADAGMTLYSVGTLKEVPGYKNYVSIDGGMTDNPRFALYGSPYTILPVAKDTDKDTEICSVVGRCCESGDILQENIPMPRDVKRGDLLACLTTGAYHYSMASNYNRIPRLPVVMLRDGESYVAVRRETPEDVAALDV